jgi:hypothetical protein
MAAGDMIFLFRGGVSSGTWTVPTGVTAIKIECFGGTNGGSFNTNQIQSKMVGGSYSQTSSLSVTAGSTIYFNRSIAGSNWINKTSNAAPTSTTDGCLAVGGGTAAASQVAANVGDIKYAGGDGIEYPAGTTTMYGTGGQAGPNGAGANVGAAYSATPFIAPVTSFAYTIANGGGANGGVSGGLGSIPYGRSSGAFGGNGGYWSGTANVSATQDVLGQAQYLNGYPLRTPLNYGPFGGSQAVYVSYDGDNDVFNVGGQEPFIVITVIAATQKSIVFSGSQSGSFTVPSDFGSLVSIRAFGAAGINSTSISSSQGGGGGGGGYSETVAASITTPITAGSTLVYYSVPELPTSIVSASSCWINIGTNSVPTAVTSGVLANSGGNTSTNTGGAGGSVTGAVGSTTRAGGTGGTGFTSVSRGGGGGGGAAGPAAVGGAGGNAYNLSTLRGGGGGGASNGGAGGAGGNATTNSAGGSGGSVSGGSGGTGATATVAATAGTNGGGSGGGFGATGNNTPPTGSILSFEGGLYLINGGTGGKGGQTGAYSQGGKGGAGVYSDSVGTLIYGDGLVVFTYNSATPVATSEGNFFFLF